MIGRMISHYKILAELGHGGMGVVYKAEDTKLQRTVAIKFLSAGELGGTEGKQRFVHEARAAAALDHPNICPIYEINEADGQTFIVMACLEGEHLGARIARGPLPLDQVIATAKQIAAALEAAHEKQIVHRDIKSENVMIDERGRVRVMDFGLAKQAGQTTVTKEGMSVGTMAYMSPEQAEGAQVDTRADIWALGVVMYEMITGQLPFRGAVDHAVLYSILHEEPEPVTALRTGVPMALEHLVKKALAKDAGSRYQNATDLVIDLKRVEQELTAAKGDKPKPAERVTLVRDLLNRRVPQILAAYALLGAGAVFLIRWLVDRYPISPNLEGLALVLLVSLLPTVLLVAYYHGAPGRNRVTQVEQIGIPANLVMAALLLLVFFRGQELGAATTTVVSTDAEGQAIEREIPKSEFRKRVGLFYFDNETGDTANAWISFGIAYLLQMEYLQDDYVDGRWGFVDAHRRAGFQSPVGSPLTLKRKIAKDERQGYFVTGSFTAQDSAYLLRTSLYETETGKRLAEFSQSGSDLFILADSLSVRLKRAMGVPSYHIDRTPDLPVAEVLTKSPKAYRLFTTANAAMEVDNDYERACELLEQAVQIDPTFAAAYLDMGWAYEGMGNQAATLEAQQQAMNHRYKLPAQLQYTLRIAYHISRVEVDALYDVVRQFVELYPYSVDAHTYLAYGHEMQGRVDSAIVEYEKILNLDPSRHERLLTISRLYEGIGDLARATEYAERYAELYPDRFESFARIAALFSNKGDLALAKTNLRKALTIEPDHVATLVSLAVLESKLGNQDEALRVYDRAVQAARSSDDSSSVYRSMADYFRSGGRMKEAINSIKRCAELAARTVPPGEMRWLRAQNDAHYYAEAGLVDSAQAMLAAAEAGDLDPVSRGFAADMYFGAFAEADLPALADTLRAKLSLTETAFNTIGAKDERYRLWRTRALIAHFEGDHTRAANLYETALDSIPMNLPVTARNLRLLAGQCRYEAGDPKAARGHLEKALEMNPYYPRANFAAARVYHDLGEHEKAMTCLSKALERWQQADPDYKPAQEARAALAEWKAAS